ncbi:MAG TPA: CehA/McbA family metallohydrolase [Sandaracinaceae bacterium LLY-WYZ-13_1]|nr:CehA/McbA family metallohydrolase [Sandaracinaceae bacterium LLY-WYZ-13_1]
MCPRVALLACLCLGCDGGRAAAPRPPNAALRLVLSDAAGAPLGARVGVLRGGRWVEALPFRGGLGWRTRRQDFLDGGGERFVYVGPDAELTVPPGRLRLVIRRGQAFAPIARTVRVAPGGRVTVRATLRRWSDRRTRGWRCGDLHLHLARLHHERDGALRELLDAEDLDVAALVDWAGRADGGFAPGWGGWEWRAAQLARSARRDGRLVFAGQGWGRPDRACTLALFGHARPVEGVSRYSPPAIVEAVRAQGGLASGTMGEVPIDGAVLGRVDATEILSHGRMAHLEDWYALLNVGARVAAVAGSDVQGTPWPTTLVDYHSPPGASRVCVRLEDAALTRAAFLDAIRAGRTFVTSGPTLELTVDGRPVGATVERPGPGLVTVRVRLRAPSPPGGRLRLIRNGETVWERAADETAVDASVELAVDQSAWLAARLDGDARLPGGDVQVAHTSPVWVRVAGAAVFDDDAAAHLRERLPRADAIATSGRSSAHERRVALRWLREARARLAGSR